MRWERRVESGERGEGRGRGESDIIAHVCLPITVLQRFWKRGYRTFLAVPPPAFLYDLVEGLGRCSHYPSHASLTTSDYGVPDLYEPIY